MARVEVPHEAGGSVVFRVLGDKGIMDILPICIDALFLTRVPNVVEI